MQRVALILVRVARVHLLCTAPVQEARRRRSVYRSNDYETRCILMTNRRFERLRITTTHNIRRYTALSVFLTDNKR
jgi:hypothetical protein